MPVYNPVKTSMKRVLSWIIETCGGVGVSKMCREWNYFPDSRAITGGVTGGGRSFPFGPDHDVSMTALISVGIYGTLAETTG